jgi:hypothetical protein
MYSSTAAPLCIPDSKKRQKPSFRSAGRGVPGPSGLPATLLEFLKMDKNPESFDIFRISPDLLAPDSPFDVPLARIEPVSVPVSVAVVVAIAVAVVVAVVVADGSGGVDDDFFET